MEDLGWNWQQGALQAPRPLDHPWELIGKFLAGPLGLPRFLSSPASPPPGAT